ncbi:MAG: hypothetical protein WCC92_20540 [Candidatus Korobacteraceae bacterium]
MQSFWYRPNVAPPKDYSKWDDMITRFTKHLVDRYGIDEVACSLRKDGQPSLSHPGRDSPVAR